ncbi:MAG TPA: methyltransferase domain-containing protein [Arenicellales bacterium]|nr:methyltransferase domain-containing protein [Arenicellales bacterium]
MVTMRRYEEVVGAAARASDRSYLAPEIVRQRMRVMELLALRAGESVLDAGCGVGLLSEPMAREVGRGGRLVGVDVTADVLEKARKRCSGLDHTMFQQGSVERLALDEAGFDAAVCTQVLLYVQDVPRALAELYRVLKPGGRLVIVETDWAGTVLNSGMPSVTRRIIAGWDSVVASPNLPRTLAPKLRDAGFAAVRVEALPILRTSVTPGDFVYSSLVSFADEAPKRSDVSEQDAAAWREDLMQRQKDGAFFFCVNRFLFSAVKT